MKLADISSLTFQNPELRRFAWLDMSPIRLVLAPALILLVLSMLNISEYDAKLTYQACYMAFIALTICGGSFQIAQTVISERLNGTWEWQKLSALTAGKLTVGKLIGGCLYKWYSGAILLGIMLYVSFGFGPEGVNLAKVGDRAPQVVTVSSTVYFIIALILAALAAHGVTLFLSSIQAGRIAKQTRMSALSVALPGALGGIGLAIAALAAVTATASIEGLNRAIPAVQWYGATPDVSTFNFFSQCFFAFWAVYAAYRLMRHQLQYNDTILAFIAFLMTFTAYWSGFGEGTADFRENPLEYLRVHTVPLFVCILACYFVAPLEAMQTTRYPRWWADVKAKAWERLIYTTPLWFVAYAILTLFCFGRIAFAQGSTLVVTSFYLPMLLFIMRDMLVLHLLVLMKSNKRALAAFGLYLFVAYLGLPFLFKESIATNEFTASLFFPLPAKTSGQLLSHMIPVIVQCVGLGSWLFSRWQDRQKLLESGK
jgi:hypothetical protein